MDNYPARRKYVPRIRYWSSGLIAISAMTRIDILLGSSRRANAQAMIGEWVLASVPVVSLYEFHVKTYV
jgi:hypothetical protein